MPYRRKIDIEVVKFSELLVANVLGVAESRSGPEQRRLPDGTEVAEALGPEARRSAGYTDDQRLWPLCVRYELVLLWRPLKKIKSIFSPEIVFVFLKKVLFFLKTDYFITIIIIQHKQISFIGAAVISLEN